MGGASIISEYPDAFGVLCALTFAEPEKYLILMAYHRQGAPTRLTTDASSIGIGTILEQEQEDGSYRPIYYARRKLSEVE